MRSFKGASDLRMLQQRKKEVKVLDKVLEEKRVEHTEKMDELAVRRQHILRMKEEVS